MGIQYVGMTERIELIKMSLPPRERKLAFQKTNLVLIKEISFSQSCFLGLFLAKGIPR